MYLHSSSDKPIINYDVYGEFSSVDNFSVLLFWFYGPQLYCFGSLSAASFSAAEGIKNQLLQV